MISKLVRCAIYTRKSSEEGLDQSFNSLEAQREACQSFILSQKHEGWIALKTQYDDGGFSGGNMERPALGQILNDIKAGEIDTVVVYKVDRLTRSLTDFSKIIEIFDSQSVSFVSVTQQFNTTTSMGRLTLNVLLSFAQFEREVTGERIRDKIAASKKKGMWMGGNVPLGYDSVNRQLVVNVEEAETVREIFRQYLRLGSVRKLKRILEKKQISGSTQIAKNGQLARGRVFARGALYHLLKNPVYIGRIQHRKLIYQGQHEPIVPIDLWQRVSEHLSANRGGHRKPVSRSSASLLGGKLFDDCGNRLTPTHSVKKSKRYRYYTSQAIIEDVENRSKIARLPAHELEQLVRQQVRNCLAKPNECAAAIKDETIRETFTASSHKMYTNWMRSDLSAQDDLIRAVLHRVTVRETTIVVEIDRAELVASVAGLESDASCFFSERSDEILRLIAPFQVARRGNEARIIDQSNEAWSDNAPVASLVKLVAWAHSWHEKIVSGEIETVKQIADDSGLISRYVRKILSCAVLSPEITEAIITGKHRPTMIRNDLTKIPLAWHEQQKLFGDGSWG